MRLVCQQPNYLPWLGYFEQIARADVFVLLDHVQWIRQGRQHRTRLPAPRGAQDPFWLTVPVHGSGHRQIPLREIAVDNAQNWPRRHWETVRAIYGKAPFFRTQLEPLLRPFYETAGRHRFLSDLCLASVSLFWEPFGLRTSLDFSSELAPSGQKSEMLLGLCRHFGADEYYSALGSSRYLDPVLFREAGVRVRFQHFRHSALDPLRPCDYSVLDWVAQVEWSEIRSKLGTESPELSMIDKPKNAPGAAAHSHLPARDAAFQ
jgi:WbqC-like protein family